MQSSEVWTTYSNASFVISLACDGSNLWVTTGGGMLLVNPADQTYIKYTSSNSGLASNNVYAVAIDGAGNKWFGTDSGVSKFDGTNWTTYTSANGLARSAVHVIAIDSAGSRWFGTGGGGVSKFDGTNWTTYTTADGLASNNIYAINIDSGGNKWFGTDAGVSKFDGTT